MMRETFLYVAAQSPEEVKWFGLPVGDVAGFSGVALSLVALIWQGISAFRRRRRLHVTAQNVPIWEAAKGDQPERSYTLFKVSVRSLGGSNGVEEYVFHWEPDPGSWHRINEPGPFQIANPGPESQVLEEGQLEERYFRLFADSRVSGHGTYKLKVEVRLVNKKSFYSNEVLVTPE